MFSLLCFCLSIKNSHQSFTCLRYRCFSIRYIYYINRILSNTLITRYFRGCPLFSVALCKQISYFVHAGSTRRDFCFIQPYSVTRKLLYISAKILCIFIRYLCIFIHLILIIPYLIGEIQTQIFAYWLYKILLFVPSYLDFIQLTFYYHIPFYIISLFTPLHSYFLIICYYLYIILCILLYFYIFISYYFINILFLCIIILFANMRFILRDYILYMCF